MNVATFKNLALGLGLSIVFGATAFAQGAAPATAAPAGPVPTKVAVVNIQQAIGDSNEGKKDLDALEQKFSPKQAELKGLSDEVETLKKQYQAQADKLGDAEKASRAKTIETKQKSLQRNYEDAQAEFQQAEQEVINRIGAKMLVVLEKYSVAHGYAMVLDVSNPQTSTVLWATQGSVITKELVDAYNTESPSSAPAKPAAGAAARPAARPAAPAATPKKP
ncbi:MAG TPA: OmpH family outer membrane protein [Candidatus Angelobacter sp.]|jgi:outer membrane protein